MSTALVSAFPDYGEHLYKSTLSLSTHRTPFQLSDKSFSSITLPGRRIVAASPVAAPSSPPLKLSSLQNSSPGMTIAPTPTASAVSSSVNSVREQHRKLDRSLSEPVDRNSSSSQQQQRPSQPNSSRYKTELCRPFEENGTCKYGDKCQFAHGVHELRTLARHPKYKTELCRTFHSTGFCPYGPRCHFIHNSEETKKSLLTNLQAGFHGTPPVVSAPPRPKELTLGGSFNLGSAGELSPPSSLSASPTSLSGFFVDDSYVAFSPAPHTAPPTTNSFFFGQDYVPLNAVKSQVSQQAPLATLTNQPPPPPPPSAAASFVSTNSNESPTVEFRESLLTFPTIDTAPSSPVSSLSPELERLNLENSPVPATCTSPLDVSRNLPRLPIFSRLAHGESD